MRNYEDRAVRFGESAEGGLENDKVFPFLYNFISKNDDNWDAVKAVDNMAGVGVRVAPGAIVSHAIRMDQDHPYMLKSIRLNVYFDAGVAPGGPYEWYDNEAGFTFLDVSCPNDCIGTPLIRFIRLDVTISPSDTKLMGGLAFEPYVPAGTFGGKRPMPVNCMQGTDYGRGEGCVQALIARAGMVNLEITNTHAVKTLIVGGMLEGVKVRI